LGREVASLSSFYVGECPMFQKVSGGSMKLLSFWKSPGKEKKNCVCTSSLINRSMDPINIGSHPTKEY
jgi:hypothetical protein